ncbi:MAG: hypothetical protein WC385_01380 [Candidatus Paceibacterota bacterium]|jgi:uncharacterized membrane protein YeaQ/YmgE (transglycosylase-associated protein family)
MSICWVLLFIIAGAVAGVKGAFVLSTRVLHDKDSECRDKANECPFTYGLAVIFGILGAVIAPTIVSAIHHYWF